MRRKDEPSSSPIKRRSLLRGLATGLAGAVVAPGASSLAGGAESPSPSGGEAQPTAEAAVPSLLSELERPTLVSLCELLVPGSVEADVPDLVERAAAVDVSDRQNAFLAAIRAFEGEARSVHGSRWIDLGRDVHIAILERAANGAPPTLGGHLVFLRDAVARAYFATEPGMRMLGWTRRSAWRELPGCNHPDDVHR